MEIALVTEGVRSSHVGLNKKLKTTDLFFRVVYSFDYK